MQRGRWTKEKITFPWYFFQPTKRTKLDNGPKAIFSLNCFLKEKDFIISPYLLFLLL